MVVRFVIQAADRRGDTDRVPFQVALDDGPGKRRTVRPWSLCGPGDEGEPVLTIMLEGGTEP